MFFSLVWRCKGNYDWLTESVCNAFSSHRRFFVNNHNFINPRCSLIMLNFQSLAISAKLSIQMDIKLIYIHTTLEVRFVTTFLQIYWLHIFAGYDTSKKAWIQFDKIHIPFILNKSRKMNLLFQHFCCSNEKSKWMSFSFLFKRISFHKFKWNNSLVWAIRDLEMLLIKHFNI